MRTRLAARVKRIFEKAPPRLRSASYLVYYDGGLDSVAALRQACEMASPETRVVAVFLEVVPYAQEISGDAPTHAMRAQAILAAALANARLYHREIETLSVPCHVQGPALVNLAQQRGSTALFMGVNRSALENHLNPFAEYVLALAPCQVVLVEA